MAYKEKQYDHQAEVLRQNPELFSHDPGNGTFKKNTYPFVLKQGINNLYEPIRKDVCRYFKENDISWWGGYKPSSHMLSSQIACLNHLFYIREDHEAVLSLVNGIHPDLKFVKVLPIPLDKDEKYIAFEAVSDNDNMNEGEPTRGANCTSVDALIVAEKENGEVWLIPIEWKYTESYPPVDKSQEDKPGEAEGTNGRGRTRLDRYSNLIQQSEYLRKFDSYPHSPYFFEPFYQLMRQTIWAEQMIAHKHDERIKADHFYHLHIIPADNSTLLQKKYRCTGKCMEESWKGLLLQDTYQIITPKEFLSPVKGNSNYTDLINYLTIRYW